MKEKYTLEDIKILLNESRYEELNYVINLIKDGKNAITEDVAILDYLSKSELIHPESREELNKLKEEVEKEVIENDEKLEVVDNTISPENTTLEVEETVGLVAAEELLQEKQEENTKLVEEEYKEATIEKKLESDMESASFVNNLHNKGLTVKDFKIGTEFPHISFELNNMSKPYLDNLMKQLYDNRNPGIGYDLIKIGATKEEIFTIYLNDPTIDPNKLIQRTEEMVNSIENIVNETDPEKDYTENMPDSLKNMKEQFKNDAPDVPQNENFRIGYINSNGIDNFYIMAGSKQEAIKLTEELGYKSREYIGAGVVKVDTEKINTEDTKLKDASENVNEMNSGQAQVIRIEEKRKVKTLGAMPNKIEAFVDYKSIALVIVLIIIVMVLVYMMG